MATENEKMLSGEMYYATDPQVIAARRRALDLCKMLNKSHDSGQELREHIIRELFGRAGDAIWIELPFYCACGSNIATRSQTNREKISPRGSTKKEFILKDSN